MPRSSRYNEEQKKEIIRLHEEEGRTQASLIEEYELGKSTLAKWLTEHRRARKEAEGHNITELKDSAELQALRLKLAAREEEIIFLKKAVAFFAKDVK